MRKPSSELACDLCPLPAHQLFLCRVHWAIVPRHLARAWERVPAKGGSVPQRMAAALPILELIAAAKKRNNQPPAPPALVG